MATKSPSKRKVAVPRKAPAAKKARIRNPEQTRARLLQATVEILAQKGVDGLSLKDAALLANVSRRAAYQHFEDRDHLLREAKNWITERLRDAMSAVDPAAPDVSLLEMARLIQSHRDAATLMVTEAIAGRDFSPDHPVTSQMRRSLQRLKASGHARPGLDVEVLVYIFLAMVGAQVMLSRLPGADKEDIALRFTRELSAFMRFGIFKSESSRKQKK